MIATAAPAAADEAAPPPATEVKPVELRITGIPLSEGREFLVADEAGTVYIVHGAENRAFVVDGDGSADLFAAFEPSAGTTLADAWAAAVGDGGKTWVFMEGPAGHELRVFRGDQEVAVQSPVWRIVSVGVAGKDPVAALAPMRPRDAGVSPGQKIEPPALLVRLDKDEWKPLVDRLQADLASSLEEMQTWGMSGYETLMTPDEDGRMLVARRRAYDLREYSASGVLEDRVVLDGGKVTRERIPEEFAERLAEDGDHDHDHDLYRAATRPSLRISAIAWGPEGEALALSRGEDGWAIDRYSRALQTFERIAIDGLEGTSFQLAAGSDGLYLARPGDCRTLYRIGWESLRQATGETIAFERDLEGTVAEPAS